jgi:hypothetical protein
MRRICFCLAVLLAGCATTRDMPPEPAPAPAPVSTAPVQAPAIVETQPPAAVPETPVVTSPAPPVATPPPVAVPPAAKPKPLTYVELAAINSDRLIDVFPGMNRETVEKIMDVQNDGRALNPQRQEWLRDSGGRLYHVLHYMTREPARGKPVHENLLTPVIFLDDKVVSIGRYPLKKLRRTACSARSATARCTPAAQ